jgi:hypothetical protein
MLDDTHQVCELTSIEVCIWDYSESGNKSGPDLFQNYIEFTRINTEST